MSSFGSLAKKSQLSTTQHFSDSVMSVSLVNHISFTGELLTDVLNMLSAHYR